MDQPKKPGRKALPETEKLVRVTLYVHPETRANIEKHGQSWARAVLRRARPPKPPAE